MNVKHSIFAVGLTMSPVLALAQGWRGNNCWGYGFPGFLGGGWMMVLWAVVLIGIIFLLGKWIVRSNLKHQTSNNAIGILSERYAKGEISRDDFLKLKDDLS